MGHERDSKSSATGAGLDPATARAVATILHGLATPSRVRIIDALSQGPRSVGDLVDHLGMEQSAVSHQLRHLRDLRFITAEKQGRRVIYRLFDNHVPDLIDQGLAHAEHLRLDEDEAPGRQPETGGPARDT